MHPSWSNKAPTQTGDYQQRANFEPSPLIWLIVDWKSSDEFLSLRANPTFGARLVFAVKGETLNTATGDSKAPQLLFRQTTTSLINLSSCYRRNPGTFHRPILRLHYSFSSIRLSSLVCCHLQQHLLANFFRLVAPPLRKFPRGALALITLGNKLFSFIWPPLLLCRSQCECSSFIFHIVTVQAARMAVWNSQIFNLFLVRICETVKNQMSVCF